MVEYLVEAQKFVQRAREAYSAEARNQDLDMADWCIARAISESRLSPPPGAAKPASQSVKPS